jgi:hypothetical protein
MHPHNRRADRNTEPIAGRVWVPLADRTAKLGIFEADPENLQIGDATLDESTM